MQRQAYNCVHNVLQAHAAAVQEFRTVVPDGKISINLNSDWGEPSNKNSEADKVNPSSLNLREYFSNCISTTSMLFRVPVLARKVCNI